MELYRKYRPGTIEEMVGNEATIKAVNSELKNGSHVFLFTGNAGCGKTTMARIIAKQVGASSLCIQEINSAENRGIDTARDIMEKMKYLPSDGDALVWILDEVHQQTSQSQNALLKALEDTPPHVYFFLCTTDPQKLIAPLKSRCSIVNMKPLSNSEMLDLLRRTMKAEGRKISKAVAEQIVEHAQGGSRKALKLLAKVLYLDDEEEMLEVLENNEGGETKEVIELCRQLLQTGTTWNKLATLIKSIDCSDAEKVRYAVLGYMNAVLLNGKATPQAVSAMQAFSNPSYNNGKFQITIACLDYLDLLDA